MEETILQINNSIAEMFNANTRPIEWEYKSAPQKWSKKEIIGHLIDSAGINLQRFVRCTYEENFKLTYKQNEWVKAQHYQRADIIELLAIWRSLNLQIVRVLKNYPADRLNAQCDTGKTSIILHSVNWLAIGYAQHMTHHLLQIY